MSVPTTDIFYLLHCFQSAYVNQHMAADINSKIKRVDCVPASLVTGCCVQSMFFPREARQPFCSLGAALRPLKMFDWVQQATQMLLPGFLASVDKSQRMRCQQGSSIQSILHKIGRVHVRPDRSARASSSWTFTLAERSDSATGGDF